MRFSPIHLSCGPVLTTVGSVLSSCWNSKFGWVNGTRHQTSNRCHVQHLICWLNWPLWLELVALPKLCAVCWGREFIVKICVVVWIQAGLPEFDFLRIHVIFMLWHYIWSSAHIYVGIRTTLYNPATGNTLLFQTFCSIHCNILESCSHFTITTSDEFSCDLYSSIDRGNMPSVSGRNSYLRGEVIQNMYCDIQEIKKLYTLSYLTIFKCVKI
mgnify:FL=1